MMGGRAGWLGVYVWVDVQAVHVQAVGFRPGFRSTFTPGFQAFVIFPLPGRVSLIDSHTAEPFEERLAADSECACGARFILPQPSESLPDHFFLEHPNCRFKVPLRHRNDAVALPDVVREEFGPYLFVSF